MKKKYQITNEEFTAIQEALERVLALWHYSNIESNNGKGRCQVMSKETFFESLRREFIINE